MKHTILVVGATGNVGAELVKTLKAQGHSVRSTTSKKAQSPDQVHVNLVTGEGRTEAFKGIDRAFFLSPAGYHAQDQILIPLIEEAKKQGLKKVVLMTAMGANANEEAPLRKAEVALEKSGLTYNIIRPNWFLQNFNTFWIADINQKNAILLPAGDAKVSFIDSRDISDVAAKLVVSDDFKNQAFDLTGPEAVDHTVVAKAISEVSGKKVSYKEITPEEFKKNVMAHGITSEYADLLNMILGFLKAGYSAAVNDSVEKITGHKPRGLAGYVKDYKAQWK